MPSGVTVAMTRIDERPEAQMSYGSRRKGRDWMFWLVSGAAFLGGVLLQLL